MAKRVNRTIEQEPHQKGYALCYGNPENAVKELLSNVAYAEEPSCVNKVRAHRYIVTVELVEEPAEDILQRLLHMFNAPDTSRNQRDDIKRTIEGLGYGLRIADGKAVATRKGA